MTVGAPVGITHSIAAPLANATVTLFSSVACYQGKRMAQYGGLKRLFIDLDHDQTLTFKAYASSDRGTNWTQVFDSGAVVAPGATDSSQVDFNFEPYDDFKLEVLNGGANQGAATWKLFMCMTDERGPVA